jgi:putative endonuclease
METKKVFGAGCEQTAVSYLEGRGFRILDRNWQHPAGRLDTVAVERDTLVVCELRTRQRTRHVSSLEKMSNAKRRRLRAMAISWLNAHGMRFDKIRIDVLDLLYEGTGGFTIEHVREVG